MSNKLIGTFVAVVALAFCGQSFAQMPDKTGAVPNINPNIPDQPAPKHHHKKSHAKKSNHSATSAPAKGVEAAPPTDANAVNPSK